MKRHVAAVLISITFLGSITGCGKEADIGKDKATEIALKDAGFSESDVTRLRVSQDRDDGQNIYEVEFTGNTTEYEYEILASNGDILSADYGESNMINQNGQNTNGQQGQADQQNQNGQQGQTDQQNQTGQQNQNGQQGQTDQQNQNGGHNTGSHGHSGNTQDSQANVTLSIDDASKLALARVPGASAQDLKIELDYDDDGYYKYEGDIIYDQKEYEFEIDANTGDFLEWKEERR